MADHWSATRVAGRVHSAVFAPLGFDRSGTTISRSDNELVRSVRFYAGRSVEPTVQMLVSVALEGLPTAVGPYRRDALWGHPNTDRGGNWYPRPTSGEPLPELLFADARGPAAEFLLRATDLNDFVDWAQEIYRGDPHRGSWRRFQPVLPQGTSPLQAAVYAAALAGDRDAYARLANQVFEAERNFEELGRFRAELAQLVV